MMYFEHHILWRYARLYFQEDLLHIAYATTTPVGSYRRDLWIFLYEVYFVWFPTVYFQCAEYERLCLGLRSLGCGSLWDNCSPRPVGNHKLNTCLHRLTAPLTWFREFELNYGYLITYRLSRKISGREITWVWKLAKLVTADWSTGDFQR